MSNKLNKETVYLEGGITFIIPLYNSDLLEYQLKTFWYQKDNINRREVVLVDDTSNANYIDRYKKIINDERFKGIDIKYKYLPGGENKFRAGMARNAGVKLALYDIIVFLDQDVLLPDNYFNLLKRKIKKLKNNEIIFGRSIGYNRKDSYIDPKDILNKRYDKYLNKKIYKDFRDLKGFKWSRRATIFSNAILKKETFLTTTGFDENLIKWGGEDTELAFRMNRKGITFTFVDDIYIYNIKKDKMMDKYKVNSLTYNFAYFLKKHNFDKEFIYFLYSCFNLEQYELKYRLGGINDEFNKLFYRNKLYRTFKSKTPVLLLISGLGKKITKENLKKISYLKSSFSEVSFIWNEIENKKLRYIIEKSFNKVDFLSKNNRGSYLKEYKISKEKSNIYISRFGIDSDFLQIPLGKKEMRIDLNVSVGDDFYINRLGHKYKKIEDILDNVLKYYPYIVIDINFNINGFNNAIEDIYSGLENIGEKQSIVSLEEFYKKNIYKD